MKTVLSEASTLLTGVRIGIGKSRAQDRVVTAISSPFLDFLIQQAKRIVLNVVSGLDLSLSEINAQGLGPCDGIWILTVCLDLSGK